MFGYVTINPAELGERSRNRYQAYYCGMCRTLMHRYGNLGRITLSNDMTFLLVLLSSLYEPEETLSKGRCLPHPIREREYLENELSDYCADMNIALAYHKCRDDWNDEHSLAGRAEAGLLEKAYRQVENRYPEKCAAIEKCLKDIGKLEQENCLEPDAPANLTARMLGEVFVYRGDYWSVPLRTLGEGLGRFVARLTGLHPRDRGEIRLSADLLLTHGVLGMPPAAGVTELDQIVLGIFMRARIGSGRRLLGGRGRPRGGRARHGL